MVFLISYGVTNYVAVRLRREIGTGVVIPGLGLLGTLVALPIVLHHIYATEPAVLLSILGLFGALALAEFLYMEREPLEESLREIEQRLEG